ncbi:NAD(P)H-quinone oxidoreductase [Pseudaminobacter sp. NGMCC 1.201702]|uniref:NAD(P)H-quinone oxidoreductase n=1 Tax=Pseudaminobacter sp. NGMCC 1.201702 TaxID=3391825 RepID=UPI0039EFEF1F
MTTMQKMMKAVIASEPGGPEVLSLVKRPLPQPGPGEVLIRVTAAGVNRPDLMQRRGAIAVPPGVSDVLGLEVAGEIVATGPGVPESRMGESVVALVSGGGYAEYCLAHAGHCLRRPARLDSVSAAGLPEAAFTVWHNLFELGGLTPGETVLIHGGASGIGTMAVQLARATGATVLTTAGGAKKTAFLRTLGADFAIDYRSEDFVEAGRRATGGRGVDVVLDIVGGSYIERNFALLAPGGRHVSIAFMEGAVVPIDLTTVMMKSLRLTSSTLRPKSVEEKCRLARAVERHVWPLVEKGLVTPPIFQTFPLEAVVQAHRVLEDNANMGKVVLTCA